MALQNALAAETEGARTDESSDSGQDGEQPARPSNSPFSMEYDTSDYSVDADDMNNVLTALVAVTNLL